MPMFMSMSMSALMGYISSLSSYQTWLTRHPDQPPLIDSLQNRCWDTNVALEYGAEPLFAQV